LERVTLSNENEHYLGVYMVLNNKLTNEEISGKFVNQFDLVNYAIHLSRELILSGRESRSTIKTDNPALQILDEISIGKDKFEEHSVFEKPLVLHKEND